MIETDKPLMDVASAAQSPVDTQPSCAAESRLDLVTGQWSIFAPNRSDRPDEFVATAEAINPRVECPFCSGNEDTTPPAVWVGRIENGLCRPNLEDRTTRDWAVRVVPNRYPAVVAPKSQPKSPENATLLVREPVSGGHEVFIESRQHLTSLSELDPSEVRLTFLAYRDRLKFWHAAPDISYVNIFKNVGKKAGASLRHCHSQLIATDKIPVKVQTSVGRMHRHRAETGCCLHCDLIRAERKANQRIVWQNESLIAFCPFASALPMLLRITSQQHQSRFEDLDDGMIDSVSRLVHRAVSWLEQIRPQTAYNVCLSTEPSGISDPSDSFHWSIDLFPRMTQIAGFEWSSGCTINPVLPEVAATCYRKIADAENPRKLDS
jgi:UDPglucose--hexose-1-phosphate uridylyltransferase